MKRETEKKLYVITGGSSGIGLALAKKAAAAGNSVWIVARNEEKLRKALEEIKKVRNDEDGRHGYVTADLTDSDSALKMAAEIQEKAGTPDVLINSAGAAHPGYVESLDIPVFRWMMDANYFTAVNTIKSFLPAMIARKSGHIVNLSSVAGYLGIFGYSAYGSAKFAISGFSKVLKSELTRYGINVSVVYPPDTQTPMLEYEEPYKPAETRALSANAKVLSADVVADSILKKIKRNRFNIHPSWDVAFFYALQKLLPDTWIIFILNKLTNKKT